MQGNMKSGGSKKGKGIAWVEEERIPKGTSPLTRPDTLSSSDEEFEGFLKPNTLLLSCSNKVTSQAVKRFFDPLNCNVVSRTPEKGGKVTFVLKFDSTALAVNALNTKRDAQIPVGDVENPVLHNITLTRSFDSRYKSFCIRKFTQTNRNDISNCVRREFRRFGEILHFFFPTNEEKCVYLYMKLNDDVTAERVKVKNLHVRECQMKGKVTKSHSSNWQ